MKAALLVLAITAATPAGTPTAYQLYAEGKYDDSVRISLAQNDAAGYAEAARSTLAEEAGRDSPCLPCLQRAEDYARRAIATDPHLVDGNIYLAITLGLEEHIIGPDAARRQNFPDVARHAIDAALAVDPKNAWALAALGGWNLAIVHGGGAFLADLFYGATVGKGLQAFEAAFEAAPNNIAVRYQYALSLSMFNEARYQPQIEAALARVVSLPTATAYERMIQKRAGDLLELLKAGDNGAYLAVVKKYEGYPAP
ncbi:MAG: hypothetical protein KGJ78_03290 [Alphaproteobacteria bacterium]|nr:hypothetical protein [Alphaproteobacteria bacterium]